MKMQVVVHLIHLVLLVQDHLVQLVVAQVVDHLVLLLVPLQELLHHLFLQLFLPVEILVAVDVSAKLKIINALLDHLVLRVLLADLVPMDILVWMVLLVLMLKMLHHLITLLPDASTALLALKVLLDHSENPDPVDYLVPVE